MNTKIISTGSYVPQTVVSNKDYEKIMDTSDAWIVRRTGIKERRFESMSTVHMATKAAQEALKSLDVNTLDCIIVGTYTPDSFIPTVANQVRENLNVTRPIPSFDINAACSGFIYALQTANAYIRSKIYKRILVIGCDFNSRILNYEDRTSAILFGDGAGAVVVEAGETGIVDCIIGGESDTYETITLPNRTDRRAPFINRTIQEDAYFSMKGAEVFKYAVRVMNSSIQELLDRNNQSIDTIDAIIVHQANKRILESGARALNYDPSKLLSNVERYGNTSSGSVPILLDEANKQGLLKEGMRIILVAFGGGLTYGSVLIDW
ncbi:hypothetical protein AOC36_10525 [Erysipelothrix larvae]|uniref:Beta-ketoacyl-[acyl-carrier-protein] synthase III n=1 Tax=Erysipelothrix larvae TaxID=1514105 RepID=A0A0X8H1L1_9FIRM|nr:beta-ketoacyl-ACP synthase III [Erysipelothrix larvae]AMC94391.1 hypothetical protein AOC36_10525 [Erysipelothrix larvae]